MIIQPRTPGGFTIFSDDVRNELGGKLTYVGVYGGEMIIANEGPATLPILCLTIYYRDVPENFQNRPYFRVVRIDDDGVEELARMELQGEFPAAPSDSNAFADSEEEPMAYHELRIGFRLSPFNIEKPCRIAVRAYSGTDEIRLGSLRVRFDPSITNLPSEL